MGVLNNMDDKITISMIQKYEEFYNTLTEEEKGAFIDYMVLKATAYMVKKGLIEKIE